jgi:two-component SAPR family response regulator
LELVNSSALTALSLIEEEVSIVFMDIQMPDLTGLQLSKLVKGKQKLFSLLLIRSLPYKVTKWMHYYLKPFEFERFTKRF